MDLYSLGGEKIYEKYSEMLIYSISAKCIKCEIFHQQITIINFKSMPVLHYRLLQLLSTFISGLSNAIGF